MKEGELERAESAMMATLGSHPVKYRTGSPVDAVLKHIDRRSDFGDRTRQRLIFQPILDELFRKGKIAYDPLRKTIGLSDLVPQA